LDLLGGDERVDGIRDQCVGNPGSPHYMLMEYWSGELGDCLVRLDGSIKPAIVNCPSDDASERCRDSSDEATLGGDEIVRAGGVVEQRGKDGTEGTSVETKAQALERGGEIDAEIPHRRRSVIWG
jgi:hypothetical protein